MNGKEADPCIYAAQRRNQRASMLLRNVRYGIAFHFELTGIRDAFETDSENKHMCILKRRLEKGQCFRTPCLGCSEFPVRRITLVEQFDMAQMNSALQNSGDIDLGRMCYRVEFKDGGLPVNNDPDHPIYSDAASAVYYHPHMVNGVIDVAAYREGLQCF